MKNQFIFFGIWVVVFLLLYVGDIVETYIGKIGLSTIFSVIITNQQIIIYLLKQPKDNKWIKPPRK